MNIQIVPNVTHNKPMPYVVHHGTVNQPHDALARRGSTSAPTPSAEPSEAVATKVPPASPPPTAIDKLGSILNELEKVAARYPALYVLPPDHEVPQMIALIASLTSQLGVGPTPAKLEATAFLVQRILSRLFDKSISMLLHLLFRFVTNFCVGAFQRTVFLSVLTGLREVVAMQLSSIIITYLAQYSHEDEHYRKVVSAFLASHLISCAQYDDVLARLVEHHRNQYIIDLAVSLLLDTKVFILLGFHAITNLKKDFVVPTRVPKHSRCSISNCCQQHISKSKTSWVA